MDEKFKNKILILVIVLMVGFLLMALSSNQTVGHIKQDLDQERYKRMVAEENLNKTASKLSSLESELTSAQDKIQSIQAILQEGKSESSDLRAQLENVTKAKETLEKKILELKEAALKAAPPTVSTEPENQPVPQPTTP